MKCSEMDKLNNINRLRFGTRIALYQVMKTTTRARGAGFSGWLASTTGVMVEVTRLCASRIDVERELAKLAADPEWLPRLNAAWADRGLKFI